MLLSTNDIKIKYTIRYIDFIYIYVANFWLQVIDKLNN